MHSETKKQSIMGTWSRSAAVACLALMLCFIASSAFATNSWTASTGSWGTVSGWSSGVVPADTEQVKILGGNTCTLDVAAGTFTANKVTVGTSATEAALNVTSTGSLTSVLEIQVGDALKNGRITQTGGTINLNGTSSKDSKLEVGYKTGVGYYTISGGSIVGDPDYSQLQVGASGASGGTGTFTVVGTGGSVSVRYLFVGASTSSAAYTGTGTLAFEINGGVSAINVGSVYIDPTGVVEAVANLSVTKTGALPTGDIILINNTGINGVTGAFDNAAWGGTITLGSVNYTLTNTYIGGLDGLANDVALIPDIDMIVIASKCKVAAGKTQAWDDTDYSNMTDAFTASGTVALPTNVTDINAVVVTITSTTDDYVVYTETLNGFDPEDVDRTGKYKYSAKVIKGEEGNITSMTLDFRKGTFAMAGKNLDLTGLACPFEIKFTMGSNELKGNAYEAVVNGTKTIPTRLMRMYKDTLIVTKAKAKAGTKELSDSLSVSGEIAVADINITQPNLHNIPVVITWSDKDDANNVQTFTIPAESFNEPTKGRAYKCSKVVDPNGVIAATIDLDKCTFKISISKANLDVTSGDVVFGISFETPNGEFNEEDDYTLP